MPKFRFTPDTNILEAMEKSPEVVKLFEKLNLKCTNCIASTKENLKLAAVYHNVDMQTLINELNKLDIQ